MQKFQENQFKSFEKYDEETLLNIGIDCYEEMCEIDLEKYFNDKKYQNKKVLFLLKRNKISEICHEKYDLVVNLTKKYGLAKCNIKNKIDNIDFLENGVNFIYIGENKIKIENLSENSSHFDDFF